MAFAPGNEVGTGRILGCFREKEHGHHFEFSKPTERDFLPYEGYDAKVWVGPTEGSFRWASVRQTVAYIVVDEGADGEPVVEKWDIKGRRDYHKGA